MQDSKAITQPDELIDFIHLKSRRGLSQLELEDEVATDLQKATGLVDTSAADSGNLSRVLQLTGAAVPCYSAPRNPWCASCEAVHARMAGLIERVMLRCEAHAARCPLVAPQATRHKLVWESR